MTVLSREMFAEKISEIQDDLVKKGIDYRVIGSVSADAHGVISIPECSSTVDDQSDIDLIVPRNDLKGAKEVRKKFAHSDYRTKVGLAIPSQFIDLQAGNGSALTYGEYRLPLEDESVLEPHIAQFDEISVRTVSAETLRHIYLTAQDRKKYQEKISAFTAHLGDDDAEHEIQGGYTPFHDLIDLYQSYRAPSSKAVSLYFDYEKKLPPKISKYTRKLGYCAASALGWR